VKNWTKWIVFSVVLFGLSMPSGAQEVIVFCRPEEAIDWLKQEDWWGEEKRGQQLKVPHEILVAIPERWHKNAQKLPVSSKKECFYRFMLPLVVHANKMVMDQRNRLRRLDGRLARNQKLEAENLAWLRDLAVILRIVKREKAGVISYPAELKTIVHEALYKLDVIPAGLVLGQAAYESGYGTSRFAVQGNALFGQWSFGGKGLIPEQQRRNLGDHRIAAFDWPFDSVRSYFINLSSHPAYEDFRRIRADLRASGKPLRSMVLVEGLKNYSERGQAYVDTLKSIIRVNKLDIADGAEFRDEPLRFIMGATDQDSVAKLRQDIDTMRKSGEFDKIIARMRLE
jgi:uncharacterized FlgJ-related protein